MNARRRAAVAVGSVIAGMLAGAPATSAHAATPYTLPWAQVSNMVADTHGHVYVSGGQGTTGVVVLNADGTYDTTIANQAGAEGLTLSPDGSTLYVADYDASAVAAIDTTSLTETARYAVPQSPTSSVQIGGTLYVGPSTHVGIDLATGTVEQVHSQISIVGNRLLTSPADPNALYFLPPPLAAIYRFTVTDPTHLKPAGNAAVAGDAVVADPFTADLVLGTSTGAAKVALPALTPDGSYTSDPARALAASPASGGLLAIGTYHYVGNTEVDDVLVLKAGTQVSTVELASSIGYLTKLAWSADGKQLYAAQLSGTSMHVSVIDSADQPTSSLSISAAPTTVARNAAVTVSGVLDVGGAPAPAGLSVTVTRTDRNGTSTVSMVSTGPTGAWTLTDHPPVAGTNTYTATHPADAVSGTSTASTTVTVTGLTTVVTITAPATSYRLGSAVVVTAHLGTSSTNRTLTLYKALYPQAYTLVGTYTVNSLGNVSFTALIAGRTTFLAQFTGDALYSPTRATHVVLGYPLLRDSLSGQYTTSRGLAYFHHTKNPLIIGQFAPAISACIQFEAQYKSGSSWLTAAKRSLCYGTVAGQGRASVYLVGTHVVGREYRMRAIYFGSPLYGAATAPWLYLTFVT